VPGRKRPILTHTLGLLLAVIVHPVPVEDRDGAKTLRREARRSFPLIARIIADAGYQGRTMEAVVARTGVWERPIVRRCDRPRFGVLPKRWIVERTLAWISRCRRLARDYERHARKAAAFVRLAMIRLRLRRLASANMARQHSPLPREGLRNPGMLRLLARSSGLAPACSAAERSLFALRLRGSGLRHFGTGLQEPCRTRLSSLSREREFA
jgi:transposase